MIVNGFPVPIGNVLHPKVNQLLIPPLPPETDKFILLPSSEQILFLSGEHDEGFKGAKITVIVILTHDEFVQDGDSIFAQ